MLKKRKFKYLELTTKGCCVVVWSLDSDNFFFFFRISFVCLRNNVESFIPNFSVRETHQIAEAQQEKNAKLREAFGISEYFVEGSSFDPERKAKETLAKGTALQDELQAQRNAEREKSKKYALVRTPSPSKDRDDDDDGKKKKKKKKKQRDG